MKPVLFSFALPVVGEVTFTSYVVMMAVAFIVGVWGCRRAATRAGLDGELLVDLGLWMLVLGIAGSRLLAVLTDGKLLDFVHLCTAPKLVDAVDAKVAQCTASAQCGYDYLCDAATHTCYPPRDCLAALKFWHGGLTFYGGVLLAVPGAMWFCRRKRLPVWKVADLAAPFLMLSLAIGRVGCFLNGCCYGDFTDAAIGVQFPGHPGPRHPTQLYEMVTAGLLFVILSRVIGPRQQHKPGKTFGWMLILYGIARTIIEIFRADPRGALGPLSTSQVISIPLIAAGVYLVARRGAGASSPAAPDGEADDAA